MKISLIASIALAGIGMTGIANAADMPVKYRPPVVAVNTWTGCYLGAHIGGGWFRDNETNVGTINSANFPFGTQRTNSGDGVIGGGQIGCNYQFAPRWVIGIEGDFAWTGIKATSSTSGAVNPAVVNNAQERVNWIADATLRLGYLATDNLLLYAKGGAAWVNDEGSSITTDAAGNVLTIVSRDRGTHTGWLIGAGGEYRLTSHWSMKVEYNYIDLGTQTLSNFVNLGTTAPVSTGVTLLRDHETRIQTVKFGINYMFGGDAIVARY